MALVTKIGTALANLTATMDRGPDPGNFSPASATNRVLIASPPRTEKYPTHGLGWSPFSDLV